MDSNNNQEFRENYKAGKAKENADAGFQAFSCFKPQFGEKMQSGPTYIQCTKCNSRHVTSVQAKWSFWGCLCCYYCGGYYGCYQCVKGKDGTLKDAVHYCKPGDVSKENVVYRYKACDMFGN